MSRKRTDLDNGVTVWEVGRIEVRTYPNGKALMSATDDDEYGGCACSGSAEFSISENELDSLAHVAIEAAAQLRRS